MSEPNKNENPKEKKEPTNPAEPTPTAQPPSRPIVQPVLELFEILTHILVGGISYAAMRLVQYGVVQIDELCTDEATTPAIKIMFWCVEWMVTGLSVILLLGILATPVVLVWKRLYHTIRKP